MALRSGALAIDRRLKSWKQIAAFFGTDERTVKRWEEKRGLPIRRLPGATKATVYAEVAELEHWLKGATPAEDTVAPVSSGRRRRRIRAAAAAGTLLLLAIGTSFALRDGTAPPIHHQPAQDVADLYFAGRYNLERRTPESLARAVSLFAAAIRRDPAYAEAYAGLANCHLMLREYAAVPDALAYPRARAAAERALALDDQLADAHAALAFVSFFYDRNFAAGLAGFQRAIALDPSNAGAHHWYASALYHAARVPEALAQIDEAQRLDPQSHSILADKALFLSSAGRPAEAISLLSQMEAADPAYLSPHSYLASIHLTQGNYPAFLDEERIAARLSANADRAETAERAAQAYGEGGAPAMFQAIIARQRALYAAGREHAFTLAATYALSGDRPAAMAVLAEAVQRQDPYLVGLRIDPRFASLRDLPDFRRLADSVGGG